MARQYVFPAIALSKDPHTGVVRRHHVSESSVQKAVKKAARLAGINKRVTCHTFRHSFATHLLEDGCDTPGPLALVLDDKYRAQGQRVRTVQELLGHKDVRTTMTFRQAPGPLALYRTLGPGAQGPRAVQYGVQGQRAQHRSIPTFSTEERWPYAARWISVSGGRCQRFQ